MKYFSIPNTAIASFWKGDTPVDELFHSYAFGQEEQRVAFAQFLEIQNEETLVFNGWIETQPELKLFLTNGDIQQGYVEKGSLQKHTLFPAFQKYIGLLYPSFQVASALYVEWRNYLSFLPLVLIEQRALIEQEVQLVLRTQQQEEGSTCKAVIEPKAFNKAVLFFLRDEKINVFLALSQGSERVKAEWVEITLVLLADPKCNVQTAQYAFHQLSKIELNRILQASLLKAIQRFKGTHVQARQKQGLKRTRNFYAAFLLISVVVGSLLFLLFAKWQDRLETTLTTNASSLTYFELKERYHVDSLLHVAVEKRGMDSDTLGLGGTGVNLSIRTAFSNLKAESLYQKLLTGLNHYYLQSNQPTKAKNPARTLHKTEEFSRTGSLQSIQFNNTSGYEVLVIGFENKGGKQIHSRLIKPTEVTTIHAKKNWVFLILPGSGFNQDQTMPFGEINYNYDYSLYAIHTFVAKDKNNKILFKGLAGQEFEMMDQRSIFLDNNE